MFSYINKNISCVCIQEYTYIVCALYIYIYIYMREDWVTPRLHVVDVILWIPLGFEKFYSKCLKVFGKENAVSINRACYQCNVSKSFYVCMYLYANSQKPITIYITLYISIYLWYIYGYTHFFPFYFYKSVIYFQQIIKISTLHIFSTTSLVF